MNLKDIFTSVIGDGIFGKESKKDQVSNDVSVYNTPTVYTNSIQQQMIDQNIAIKNYHTLIQEAVDAHNKRLNSYNNDVKQLFNNIRPLIKTGIFTNTPNSNEILICDVIDEHLKNIKFKNKLEDIINEE